MAGLMFRATIQVRIDAVDSCLSLSTLKTPAKNLLTTACISHDRLSPDEHYKRLPRRLEPPLVVLGVRNVLANLRCIGYSRDMCDYFGVSKGTVAHVLEEFPFPGRPYHVLRYQNGRFAIDEFLPDGPVNSPQPQAAENEWLVSGTPVLWDCSRDELFERIITDSADHSHVWRLPRGNHPLASGSTNADWLALQEVFQGTLSASRETAAMALNQVALDRRLDREDKYLHSVLGVSDDGALIVVIAHGRLEDVGRLASDLGARRAICVENSGSIALYYIRDSTSTPWQSLFSAPNLRMRGTAFLFLKLADKSFGVL